MPHLSELPDELRLLLIYLLQAAKTKVQVNEPASLDEAIPQITQDELVSLQDFFPHLNVDYILSTPKTFMDALESRHLAPSVFISPTWLLKHCPATRLDTAVISELLVNDLVLRLTQYLANAPLIIRIGIYSAWLKAKPDLPIENTLAECICGSNAPLLQKLIQMIGDASAAAKELQVVKDRIAPMTDRELALVLDDADVSDLFESFNTTSEAAGSIGQGHIAKLVDGTDVFVKVKRYEIAELMEEEARIFNAPTDQSLKLKTSPWSQLATNLIKETSFALEVQNQAALKSQWTLDRNIHVVDIVSKHPATDPTILIMKVAPGTTIGRASIRFPIGLQNAVQVLNAFIQQFYANTLFYDVDAELDDAGQTVLGSCQHGYSPADPHGGNQMIHVDQVTGEVDLTIIDTASICTITKAQRNQIVDLFIAVVMGDVDGIADVMGIPYSDTVEWMTACTIYRQIIAARVKDQDRDGKILKRLVRIVEATKLVLKRPALDDLLSFGKAQLQLLDTIRQFHSAHAYEMERLGLKFESLTQVITSNLMMNNPSNRSLAKRALWAVTAGAGRKFKDSFTAWDWEADGRDGNKTWPFGL
ncbi:protein of unknown function [Taphrina deformans PYCC 5710]|uniref:ABC1 atypical kinase-like domain-containing protein n=1 Tax=Taphrina deformans (strain PYCC 5710 / ATCC 11124 / CBS 356.35 / IMI 108563 / JCM 9778 / NBRC 8474) TaxID=1097556 RepID=R4X7N3_TAPDE|nr:protein of unknown function [Taphrina deformans PYCC 5710]|eukprot:CCG81163.1 protein of unknown function [Taphrina deformans PYCC 5710]